jgi:Rod binding domain-containing protein
MSDVAATARSFLDFEGLGRLRGQARADGADPEALREAARQFEAQLLNMMLQSMRKAVVRDEQNGSGTQDLYQEMMDREVALLVARRGGIGLADSMVRQLGGAGLAGGSSSGDDQATRLRPALPAVVPLAPAAEPDTWRVLRDRAAGTGLPLSPAARGEAR